MAEIHAQLAASFQLFWGEEVWSRSLHPSDERRTTDRSAAGHDAQVQPERQEHYPTSDAGHTGGSIGGRLPDRPQATTKRAGRVELLTAAGQYVVSARLAVVCLAPA